tara:strand:- start:1226 stop:1540 length:315 start_codon:yes stop_codon:yes gene_type:complete
MREPLDGTARACAVVEKEMATLRKRHSSRHFPITQDDIPKALVKNTLQNMRMLHHAGNVDQQTMVHKRKFADENDTAAAADTLLQIVHATPSTSSIFKSEEDAE